MLVGAIELVSPANKDRESHRRAFVTQCENHLNQGVGLIVVDIVTTPNAYLHNELMQRTQISQGSFLDPLYAIAYQISRYNLRCPTLHFGENRSLLVEFSQSFSSGSKAEAVFRST